MDLHDLSAIPSNWWPMKEKELHTMGDKVRPPVQCAVIQRCVCAIPMLNDQVRAFWRKAFLTDPATEDATQQACGLH